MLYKGKNGVYMQKLINEDENLIWTERPYYSQCVQWPQSNKMLPRICTEVSHLKLWQILLFWSLNVPCYEKHHTVPKGYMKFFLTLEGADAYNVNVGRSNSVWI